MIAVSILGLCWSCNNYSISEEQAGSFLKFFALDVDNNSGSGIIQNPGGGYLIMANYDQQGISGTDRDILLIFCDEFGRMSTNSPVRVGTNGYDRAKSMIRSEDGFILAGSSQFDTLKQGYLVKINDNGQVLWQHNYGGYVEMEFNEVIQHQEGGYIMTGYVMGENGEKNIVFLKTGPEGDSLWTREIGYNGYDDEGKSIEKYEGRLLVVGTSTPRNTSELSRMLILNTDQEVKGSSTVPRLISGEANLYGEEIVLDPRGDIYVMGNERNALSGDSRIYLAKLDLASDLEGLVISESKYLEEGTSIRGEDLEPTELGGMVICGSQSIQQDYNIYFLELDKNFQVINRQVYGAKGYQSAASIYYTGDTGFALTGSVDLGGARTTFLMKLDGQGKLE